MTRQTTCPADDRLSLLAVGALAPDEAAPLQAHLAACPDCRRQFDVTRALLTSLPDDTQLPSPDEARRFAARVSAAARPSGQRFYLWGSAATALVAGLLAIFLFKPGNLPQPLEPELTAPAEMAVLQEIDLIENLDLLEDLDLLEQLENNG